MKKQDVLKDLNIMTSSKCVFIKNQSVDFCYMVADVALKDEYKGQYRYFGGLQCTFPEGSENYKLIEGWLCEIAEWNLKFTKQ